MTRKLGHESSLLLRQRHYRLTREEELELCRRKDAGDQSVKARMLESVVPLAIKLSNRMGLGRGGGLTLADDCLQEALCAAWQSLDAFDATAGRLSTWVYIPMRWAIRRYIHDNVAVLRRPAYLADEKPRQKALATESDSHRALIEGRTDPPKLLKFVGTRDPDPAEQEEVTLLRQQVKQRVEWCLSGMQPRDREVLWLRHVEAMELKQIGYKLTRRITTERVRQLLERAEQQFSMLWESPRAPYAGSVYCRQLSPDVRVLRAG